MELLQVRLRHQSTRSCGFLRLPRQLLNCRSHLWPQEPLTLRQRHQGLQARLHHDGRHQRVHHRLGVHLQKYQKKPRTHRQLPEEQNRQILPLLPHHPALVPRHHPLLAHAGGPDGQQQGFGSSRGEFLQRPENHGGCRHILRKQPATRVQPASLSPDICCLLAACGQRFQSQIPRCGFREPRQPVFPRHA